MTKEELLSHAQLQLAFYQGVIDYLNTQPTPIPDPDPDPTPDPAVEFNYKNLVMTPHSTYVAPGENLANVFVELSQAARQTMVVKYTTKNGTAKENQQFRRAEGWLIFQPGDKYKTIQVEIIKPFDGLYFYMAFSHPQNIPILDIRYRQVSITYNDTGTRPLYLHDYHPLPPRPELPQLAFDEDFSDFQATDSGFDGAGNPCWRSRMSFGRDYDHLSQVNLYADGTLHYPAQPFVKKDQWLAIQAEYWPDGIPDRDTGKTYQYTSGMMTTEKLFHVKMGDYIESRFTLPPVVGTWPAFWLNVFPGSDWPLIEFDIMEGFFTSAATMERVGTTVHWGPARGDDDSFMSFLPYLDAEPSTPHIWGMHWGEKLIVFYLDDEPYFAVPNIWPKDRETYIKLDLGVGHPNVKPNPADFPCRMFINWVRVWR